MTSHDNSYTCKLRCRSDSAAEQRKRSEVSGRINSLESPNPKINITINDDRNSFIGVGYVRLQRESLKKVCIWSLLSGHYRAYRIREVWCHDFQKTFGKCEELDYPLPLGITNTSPVHLQDSSHPLLLDTIPPVLILTYLRNHYVLNIFNLRAESYLAQFLSESPHS